MKTGIAFLVLSVLLLAAALIIGNQKQGPKSPSAVSSELDQVPTAVLPPEELSQFKNISVYTPKKKDDSDLFINPREEGSKPPEESKSVKAGIM